MIVGENRYGRYCVPAASAHRPAAQTILAGDVHEPDTIQRIIERARGEAVVHAGAYFGDFLPALHSAGLRVLAFEPNPENWLHAVGTLYLNETSGIRLSHMALGAGDHVARVVCTLEGDALGGQSYLASAGGDYDCPVRRLDGQVPESLHVAVIHLDVERYEEKVLQGALKTITRCRPTLILETVPEEWIAANLLPLGYTSTGTVHHNTVFDAQPRL